MAVWSTTSYRSVVEPDRIDADYFRPEYLCLEQSLNEASPLRECVRTIVHPAEFERTYSHAGWQVIRAQNVRPLRLDFDSNSVFVSPELARTLPHNQLKDGDILVTRTGANFGQCSLFVSRGLPALATSHTLILRVNEEIDPAFLALLLNTRQGRQLINRGMYGSSQPEIAPRFLRRVPVQRLPKADEAGLAKAVRESYAKDAKATELHQRVVDLVTSRLGLDKLGAERPLGYLTNLSSVTEAQRADPEYFDPIAASIVEQIAGLDAVRLGAVCEIRGGFAWSSTRFRDDDNGVPVVRIRNIRPYHLEADELTRLDAAYAEGIGAKKARRGDVVVGMDGVKYFNASVLQDDCLVNQRVAHLAWKKESLISPEYACFMINSRVGQAQLLRDMTVASTVGHITNRNIGNLMIPYVSPEFHDEVTQLVKESIQNAKDAKRLTAIAVARAERLIDEIGDN